MGSENRSRPVFFMCRSAAAPEAGLPAPGEENGTTDGVHILLVTEGAARFGINGSDYELCRGCVIVLLPYQAVALLGKSEDFGYEYLFFDFDFMADFPLALPPEQSERFGKNPCIHFDEAGFEAMNRCYDMLWTYYTAVAHPSRTGILKAQLFTLICELLYRSAKQSASVRKTRAEVLTDRFFYLLHRNFRTQRTLGFYAGELCITTKYLSKTIRRTTGNTVGFWIEEFTVKEAKRLLRTTQEPVAEIADRLHFQNSSFFAKFFRRHTGVSPTAFRRGDAVSGSTARKGVMCDRK